MNLNFHQKVLAYAALYGDNKAVISYKSGQDQVRVFERVLNSQAQFRELVQKFKKDPKDILAILRNNMLAIIKDTNLSMPDKLDRLKRYIDDFFDLICLLDGLAFPSTGSKIYNFVPTYIPDNLSDMGSDPRVDKSLRGEREKIHVRKKKIFAQAKELFLSLFAKGTLDKKNIVVQVAYWVYKALPYDHKAKGGFFGGKSIPLDYLKESKAPLSVCRHQALYTQVLLQAFGLTSRLLKCHLDGDAHAANLIRIDGRWYLLDVTNPIFLNGKYRICLMPIPELDIDLNKQRYTWRIKHDRGIRIYTSRNDMYFRIK